MIADAAAEAKAKAEAEAAKSAEGGDATKNKKTRHKGLDALKFWLMPFVCFASFGFPALSYGNTIRSLSLFASIAFYILCGFAEAYGEKEWKAKPADKKKGKTFYGRLVKRTSITFLVFMGVCLLLSLAYYVFFAVVQGAAFGQAMGLVPQVLSSVLRKRTLFDFFALNIWPEAFPIGATIWFLQALLYARIILWLMERLKLMRYYKALLLITALVMLLFGEFAGVIRFSIHGYTYIPGNFFTRALPYMLLGRYLYEKKDKLKKIPSWVLGVLFLLGVAATFGELALLNSLGCFVYSGHLIGYGMMALAACGFFLKKEDMKSNFAASHGRTYSRRIYLLSQPVGHILLIAVMFIPPLYGMTYALAGGLAYLVCLLIAFITGLVKSDKAKVKTRSQKEKFSLRLYIKQSHKNRSHKRRVNAKENEWNRAQGKRFSLRLWFKHIFRSHSRKRQLKQQEQELSHRGRFSLWRWFRHTFRHIFRRHRSRRNEWREPRHHHHHHHRHHHHSHGHHSDEHDQNQSE